MGATFDSPERRAEAGRGPIGPQGARGLSVLYGDGAPGTSVGTAGDHYIDKLRMRLYGPKTEAGWPASFVQLTYDTLASDIVVELEGFRDEAETAKTAAETALNTLLAEKGQADGIAELDAGGKVPATQLPDSAEARSALGLGDAAVRSVGSTGGTVAAGDDARIVGALPKNTDGSDFSQPTAVLSALGGAAKAQNLNDIFDKEAATNNLLFLQAGTGAESRSVRDKLREFISVKDFGALGDGVAFTDGAITTGTTAFTSAAGAFTSADVGKAICVAGAGAAGAPLVTTIAGYTSATAVTLASAAGTTVSGARGVYGTDDTAAIQAALTHLQTVAACVLIPTPGVYVVTDNLTATSDHPISIVSDMGPDNSTAPCSYIAIAAPITGDLLEITARGGVIRGLWFRDPTSRLGFTQGVNSVDAALKLTTFGMGRVVDCSFDGILGSAIEIDSMIRGHIVRPHIRDCGTPTRPALWLYPQSALGAGQINIDKPHIETCYGPYLEVGSNAVDTKVSEPQFEADPATANTNVDFLVNRGDRTTVVAPGFNRNTAKAVYCVGSRLQIVGGYASESSLSEGDPRLHFTATAAFCQVTGFRIQGSAVSTGTAILDEGDSNDFDGVKLYFSGNVVQGANSSWTGGSINQARTAETYCFVTGSNANVTGLIVQGAATAGGIRVINGAKVGDIQVRSNAGIGLRNDSSTSVIGMVRASSNTGGDLSFSVIPHGYVPNNCYAADGAYPLKASTTWDPGSLANGASVSQNITVTGLAVGDFVVAAFPMLAAASGASGMQISANCYAANTAKVTITNNSGGTVDLDSGTLTVSAFRK